MADRDPAAARFLIIQVQRLIGAAMVVAGAMIVAATLVAPPVLGPVLMVVGVAEFFLVPFLLARAWKSRP